MTTLYNCHTDGDQYRITKFDSLGNVESTYLCTIDECECPAGFRPSCRHRHMLPRFLAKGAVNSFYFYDYDRQGWVTNEPAPSQQETSTFLYTTDEPPMPITNVDLFVEAKPEPAMIEPKLHHEQPHHRDEEQLALYQAGADLAEPAPPEPTIRRRI